MYLMHKRPKLIHPPCKRLKYTKAILCQDIQGMGRLICYQCLVKVVVKSRIDVDYLTHLLLNKDAWMKIVCARNCKM
jgi:hypothetical protein